MRLIVSPAQADKPRLATAAFRVARWVVPVCRWALALLPERLGRATLATLFVHFPNLWGMFEDSKRLRAAIQAYGMAFPGRDAGAFVAEWMACRGDDLATALTIAARMTTARHSHLLRNEAGIRTDTAGRACIVALLHYSTDPVLPLWLLCSNPDRDFRLAMYPVQPGVEDDRGLWFSAGRVPPSIRNKFFEITDPTWVMRALRHIESGGDLIVAIDAPFDGRSVSTSFLKIGRLRMPLASSVEFLARSSGAQLLFAWPEAGAHKAWTLRARAVADVYELAAVASDWIEANEHHWAGWPYLRWREDSVAMRRNVAKLNRYRSPSTFHS